jgi:hypothetical protein
VIKLPLWYKIIKMGMICFAKPVLTGYSEDLHTAQKQEFSITYYMGDMYTLRNAKHIHKRQTHPLDRVDVTQGL